MNSRCNNLLTTIAISIIISLILTLLFFNGTVENAFISFIFALILSLVSLLILTIFGTSDNGLTRTSLCQNCLGLIISILGNIFSNLIALLIPLLSGNILSAFIFAIAFFFLVLNTLNLISLILYILRYE